MVKTEKSGISRRQFASRAALLSATASLAPAAAALADTLAVPATQETPPARPSLSAESQAEADARWQQILNLYGSRFSEDDKKLLQHLNLNTQETLDRVRAYPLENGDSPALYLKPLVEREKKTVAAPAAAPARKS